MKNIHIHLLVLFWSAISSILCASIHRISIDGSFDDWSSIPTYSDPDDAWDGSVMDGNVADCHDTDHETLDYPPDHVYNENVNILEYKVSCSSIQFFNIYMRFITVLND